MRILLSILISIAPILGYAQTTGKILEGNAALGIQSVTNYVINSNAEKNTNSILTSGLTLARDCSGAEVIDGTCSFTLQSSTSGDYAKWSANPMNAGKKGANCAAYFRYQYDALGSASDSWYAVVEDGSTNEISPRVSLTTTYNSLAAANDGTSRIAMIPGYPCKESQENRLAIKHTASLSSLVTVEEVHVIDYPNPTSVPQGAEFFGSLKFANSLNCNWARNSSSWGNFSVDSDCAVPTTKGNLVYQGTKIPAFVLPAGSPPGRYVITATGAFYKNSTAADVAGFRFSDGTNTSSQQAVFNSAASAQAPVISGEITYSSALPSATTVQVQCIGTATTGCQIDVSSTGIPELEFTVVRYPLTTSSDVVVPASCINNPDCQNVFSAKVTSAGVVSDENYDFISGNCTASNPWTCTFRTALFSTSPTCLAMSVNTSSTTNVTSVSTSSVVLTNTAGNQAFNLVCIRAGTDVKPWGPIPWLTGMESNDLPTSQRNVSFEFAGAASSTTNCTSNPCTVRNSSLAGITVAWVSAGVQTVTFPANTWRSVDDYTCLPGLINFAGANGPAITAQKVSATSMTVTCTAAGVVNCAGVLKCWGPR